MLARAPLRRHVVLHLQRVRDVAHARRVSGAPPRVRALRSRARRVARALSRYITRLRGYHDALALGEESYYHTPGKLREMQRRESECDGWMRECRAAWTDTIAAEDLAAARQANRTRRRLRWTAAHGSRLPSR